MTGCGILSFPFPGIVSHLFAEIARIPAQPLTLNALLSFHMDLMMPLGKLGNDAGRNTFDFKVPRVGLDLIPEFVQALCQFMVIAILHKLLSTVHSRRGQCLPPIFHRVKSGIEDHAMGMQMRVQFPAGSQLGADYALGVISDGTPVRSRYARRGARAAESDSLLMN